MTGTEDYISADQGCVEKMEYTVPELAISRFIIEFGDRLSDHLSYIGSYTELLTGSKNERNILITFSG